MTARQLALDICDPTWDPEPDDDEDDDDGPWCRWSRDLWGQGIGSDRLDHMTDVPTGEYL